MATKEEVYAVINKEREYQGTRWNDTTTTTGGYHSVTEWLVYVQDYVNEALHILSRNNEPGASEFALHNVRKIAALAVACMEEHGAPVRK